MTASLLELYDALRLSLGEKHALNITSFMELHAKNSREQDVQKFASKIDLNEVKAELKQDVSDLKIELKQDINNLRVELKQDIGNLKTDLNKRIDGTKTDVVRWMFALFVAVLLAVMGLYLKK